MITIITVLKHSFVCVRLFRAFPDARQPDSRFCHASQLKSKKVRNSTLICLSPATRSSMQCLVK